MFYYKNQIFFMSNFRKILFSDLLPFLKNKKVKLQPSGQCISLKNNKKIITTPSGR